MICRVSVIVLGLLLSACSDDLDDKLRGIVDFHQIKSNPLVDAGQQFSDINSKEAQLGKLLFFTKALSGDKDVACASCHHPFLGGDDDLSLSVGVDPVEASVLGITRKNTTGEILVPRNAPTTFNSSLWTRHLFHDGRVERLNNFNDLPAQISTPDEAFGDIDSRATSLVQAQAGFPVTSKHEMRSNYNESSSNDRLRESLLKNLIGSVQSDESNGNVTWEELFNAIYIQSEPEKLITFERVQELIGVYEKSQVFIDTPWKDYLEGDKNRISNSAKRGALLFYQSVEQGGASCVTCHSGSFFTDEDFHVLAVPQIGEGKDLNEDDTGRYLRTGVPDDRYAFRTPSLINVTETSPYGHSGSFENLYEIIEHHGDPEASTLKYDYSLSKLFQSGIKHNRAKENTQKALGQLVKNKNSGRSKLPNRVMSSSEIKDLIEFLKTLTDPCTKSIECLSPWVPAADEPNPDGLILYSDI